MNGMTVDFNDCKTEVYFSDVSSAIKKIDFNGRKVAVFASKLAEDAVLKLKEDIKAGGGDVYTYLTDDGENIKTAEKALIFTDFLLLNGFSRDSMIVNVGGGTVCDAGGFVAGVYMRGISYMNIPTTLLCAADACIGGKTALDGKNAKNIWGVFHQPEAVIIDTDLIKQGGEKALKGGLSEIVKYGIINKKFGEKLMQHENAGSIYSDMDSVVLGCLKIKAVYVLRDVKDRGARRVLNLGHTVAHAVEAFSGYGTGHAEAVAAGLFAESRLAFNLGVLSKENYLFIDRLCSKYLDEYRYKGDIRDLMEFMAKDKKNENGRIGFSLPTDDGVRVFHFSAEEVSELFLNGCFGGIS